MPDPEKTLMMHTPDGLKRIEELTKEELINMAYMLWEDLERAHKTHDQTLRIMSSLSYAKGGFKSHRVMRGGQDDGS